MSSFLSSDCIAAISTPLGQGGIGVVRVCGDGARSLAEKFFRTTSGDVFNSWESNRAVTGWVVDGDGRRLDRCVLLYFEKGKSYTGDETVEFFCHGSPLLLEKLLSLLISSGARQAEPGEFTKRAYLNGRLDLAMAEGVIDTIRASSEAALYQATRKLCGEFSRKLEKIRGDLLNIMAEIEVGLDFSEHNEGGTEEGVLLERLEEVGGCLRAFSSTYRFGKGLDEGFRVVIAGRPNSGKSSLFNKLIGETRAIVSEEAGTTRDYIEKDVEWDNLPIKLVDIAGLSQNTANNIERVGIEIGKEQIERADLVVWLRDISLCNGDDLLDIDFEKLMVVGSKGDLLQGDRPEDVELVTSSLTGEGIEELKGAVVNRLWPIRDRGNMDGIVLTSLRQKVCIDRAFAHVDSAVSLLRGKGDIELVCSEIRGAVCEIDSVLGKGDVVEDMLDAVFSEFCIGK